VLVEAALVGAAPVASLAEPVVVFSCVANMRGDTGGDLGRNMFVAEGDDDTQL
jgi:hypothetical protein